MYEKGHKVLWMFPDYFPDKNTKPSMYSPDSKDYYVASLTASGPSIFSESIPLSPLDFRDGAPPHSSLFARIREKVGSFSTFEVQLNPPATSIENISFKTDLRSIQEEFWVKTKEIISRLEENAGAHTKFTLTLMAPASETSLSPIM